MPRPCQQVKHPDGGFVSTYVKYMPPGIIMIIVFALLIPGFWFMAVHTNRTRLDVSCACWLVCRWLG